MQLPRTARAALGSLLLHACGAQGPAADDTGGASEASTAPSTTTTTDGDPDTTAPTEASSHAGTATSADSTTDIGTTASTTGLVVDTSSGADTSTAAPDDATTTETTGATATTGDDTTGGACLPDCPAGPPDDFADCVIAFDPAPATVEAGAYNHDMLPAVVLGPPVGSVGAVSLGCAGEIVLGLADPHIVDDPGPDFIVFENPFNVSFPEPGRVEVSADGCDWRAFDCDPVNLVGCAGKSVTKAVPNSGLDPTDPAVAGGDAFDLADVGLGHARYVRIVDVSAAYWSARDQSFCDPGQGGKGGFDLDALAVVHGA